MAPINVDVLHIFIVIIFSEIGEKTFLIAAILAMCHPRLLVFARRLPPLALMSTLPAVMGHVLPSLIPKQLTQVAAAVLFLIFGAKILMEASRIASENAKIQEEMKEGEQDIEIDDAGHDNDEDDDGTPPPPPPGKDNIPLQDIEVDAEARRPSRSTRPRNNNTLNEGARNFSNLFLGPFFVQAFLLTFLSEWGDRS